MGRGCKSTYALSGVTTTRWLTDGTLDKNDRCDAIPSRSDVGPGGSSPLRSDGTHNGNTLPYTPPEANDRFM